MRSPDKEMILDHKDGQTGRGWVAQKVGQSSFLGGVQTCLVKRDILGLLCAGWGLGDLWSEESKIGLF